MSSTLSSTLNDSSQVADTSLEEEVSCSEINESLLEEKKQTPSSNKRKLLPAIEKDDSAAAAKTPTRKAAMKSVREEPIMPVTPEKMETEDISSLDNSKDIEMVSRSGRRIKPKR